MTEKKRVEEVLDGILPVVIRNAFWWSLGMTNTAIGLIGLDKLMFEMFDHRRACTG